jgi:hypothetical protein
MRGGQTPTSCSEASLFVNGVGGPGAYERGSDADKKMNLDNVASQEADATTSPPHSDDWRARPYADHRHPRGKQVGERSGPPTPGFTPSPPRCWRRGWQRPSTASRSAPLCMVMRIAASMRAERQLERRSTMSPWPCRSLQACHMLSFPSDCLASHRRSNERFRLPSVWHGRSFTIS